MMLSITRTTLNQPMERLASETLLEIFMWASGGGAKARTVFKLASICRNWRRTLLDYGPAWSTVSLANRDVLQLMILRSKSAPIYIYVDANGLESSESDILMAGASHALRQAQGRVRELCISVHDQLRAHEALKGLVAETSSGLRVFELVTASRAHTVYTLSPGHLGGSMPLRRLTLQGTELIAGTSPLLHEHCHWLAHLELSAVHGIALSDILDMLSVAKNTLLTISLDIKAFTPNPATSTLTDTISLTRLRSLSLKGLAPPFTNSTPDALLSHITYGSTTVLAVSIDCPRDYVVPDALCAHLSQRRVDAKSALISQSDGHSVRPGLRLRCWPSRSMPDFFTLDQYTPAIIDVEVRLVRYDVASANVAVSALSKLAAAANVASIKRVAVAPIFRHIPWVRMLERFPNLSELTLYGPAVMSSLRNAYTSAKGKAPRDFATPRLDHLTTINVIGLVLTLPRTESPSSSQAPRSRGVGSLARWDCDSNALSQLLAALPHPLDELCISYCDTRLSDMAPLLLLVNRKNVIWDGSVRGCASVPLSLALGPNAP